MKAFLARNSLRMSFCKVPERLSSATPLSLGRHEVEGKNDRSRGIDREVHRGLVEGNAREEVGHVVDGVDGNAYAPDLRDRERVVGVITELRGQIEGDGERGLTLVQEKLEARIRVFRRNRTRRTGASSTAFPDTCWRTAPG